MTDYSQLYKTLFQAQTRAIEILQKAQQETEKMYIEALRAEIVSLAPAVPDANRRQERH